jgi:hypothetical protein
MPLTHEGDQPFCLLRHHLVSRPVARRFLLVRRLRRIPYAPGTRRRSSAPSPRPPKRGQQAGPESAPSRSLFATFPGGLGGPDRNSSDHRRDPESLARSRFGLDPSVRTACSAPLPVCGSCPLMESNHLRRGPSAAALANELRGLGEDSSGSSPGRDLIAFSAGSPDRSSIQFLETATALRSPTRHQPARGA